MPKKFPPKPDVPPKETFLTQDEYANAYPEGDDSRDPETVAQLSYGRAHREQDDAEISRLAYKLRLPENVVELHRVAFAELTEFTEVMADEEPARQAQRDLEDKILRLRRIRAVSVEQSDDVAGRLHELEAQRASAANRLRAAVGARVRHNYLETFLSPLLFAGTAGGQGLVAKTKTQAKLFELFGVHTCPWDGPEQAQTGRPIRRIISTASVNQGVSS